MKEDWVVEHRLSRLVSCEVITDSLMSSGGQLKLIISTTFFFRLWILITLQAGMFKISH